jgi:hypothetical protein
MSLLDARLGAALAAPLFALFSLSASAACRDDLLASQQRLAATRAGIQMVAARAQGEQCPAYRRHYIAMVAVRTVFAQCDLGARGAEQVAQLDSLIEAFRKRMPPGCKP